MLWCGFWPVCLDIFISVMIFERMPRLLYLDAHNGVPMLTAGLKVSAEDSYVYLDVSSDSRINEKVIGSE